MYEIPVLHPLIVHFPVAFLSAAGLVGVIWALLGKPIWRFVLALLLGAGVAAAVAALITGDAMEEAVQNATIVRELVQTHELMGQLATAASGTGLVVLLVAWMAGKLPRLSAGVRDPLWLRLVVGLLAAAAAFFVLYAGHLGGTMTWGEPV